MPNDAHRGDAASVHRYHLELTPRKARAIADARNAAESSEGVAAESRPVALRDGEAVVAAHVDERHRPRELEDAIGLDGLAHGEIILVVDVSDHLLDEILERHDAGRAAVLV